MVYDPREITPILWLTHAYTSNREAATLNPPSETSDPNWPLGRLVVGESTNAIDVCQLIL
jgi:hypothetical protein